LVSKLYQAFLNDRFFTTREASTLLPNISTRKNTLRQLLDSNQIVKVRQGIYEIVPLEQIGQQKPVADKFLLGRKLTSPHCFSHHSALEIHGFANTVIYNTVYMASPREFRSFTYEGVRYRWISRANMAGVEKTIWSSVEIVVTDREMTIVDCIDRINLGGGFEEVFKSLSSMRNVNFERLYSYAKARGKIILFHKLGFFMSQKAIGESWGIDRNKLSRIRANLSSKVYYLQSPKSKGKLVREWNLMVPEAIKGKMSFA